MKMTVEEIIKKSSVETMAKIIGSVIAMHIDGERIRHRYGNGGVA